MGNMCLFFFLRKHNQKSGAEIKKLLESFYKAVSYRQLLRKHCGLTYKHSVYQHFKMQPIIHVHLLF